MSEVKLAPSTLYTPPRWRREIVEPKVPDERQKALFKILHRKEKEIDIEFSEICSSAKPDEPSFDIYNQIRFVNKRLEIDIFNLKSKAVLRRMIELFKKEIDIMFEEIRRIVTSHWEILYTIYHINQQKFMELYEFDQLVPYEPNSDAENEDDKENLIDELIFQRNRFWKLFGLLTKNGMFYRWFEDDYKGYYGAFGSS